MSHKLDKIIEFFKDELQKNNIDIQVKIQDVLNTHLIEVDDSRLSVVLYNLLSNSVKFTDMGSISISAKMLDRNQMEEKMRQHSIQI